MREVTTPAQARSSGSTRYFTGNACLRGHVDDRLVSNGTCCACNREKVLRHYYDNHIQMRAGQAVRRKLPENLKANAEYQLQYRERPGVRERINERHALRKRADPVYDFGARARRLVTGAFVRRDMVKQGRTEAILGCSILEFRAHVEAQFRDGMGWHNRSEWHLDHIVPLATAKTIDDVVRLSHYSNIRPLWREDNLRKGARLDYHV